MLKSYKWMGWMGLGLGWKSLSALILRAPLCGANKTMRFVKNSWKMLDNKPLALAMARRHNLSLFCGLLLE